MKGGRVALMLSVLTALASGCARQPAAVVHSRAQDSSLGSRPRYAAAAFTKPGQPKLTPTEKAKIRWMMARIKPCQRALLAYAFDSNGPPSAPNAGEDARGFVMFFSDRDSQYPWLAEPHVLGGQNIVYRYETGGVAAFPNTEGFHFTLQNDINRTACRDRLRPRPARGI